MRLVNFLEKTIQQFFRTPEVRREVCSIASNCSGGGGGLTEVATTDSSNIAFTGTGTVGDPLSATITGGVVQTASNGLYVDGTEAKLGSNYTVDDTGQITTQVAIGSGSLFGGTFNGVIIDPISPATQISNGDFYLEIGNDHFILTNQASGSTIESLASTDFLRVNGGGGELSISNNELLITSLNGATYAADYSANYTNRSLIDKEYCDSVSGSITPNVVSSATTLNLQPKTYYTFNGSNAAVWTLPPVAGNVGTRLALINQGSANITVNSNAGGNDIYQGAATNSIIVAPGETYILYDNSLYHTIVA